MQFFLLLNMVTEHLVRLFLYTKSIEVCSLVRWITPTLSHSPEFRIWVGSKLFDIKLFMYVWKNLILRFFIVMTFCRKFSDTEKCLSSRWYLLKTKFYHWFQSNARYLLVRQWCLWTLLSHTKSHHRQLLIQTQCIDKFPSKMIPSTIISIDRRTVV